MKLTVKEYCKEIKDHNLRIMIENIKEQITWEPHPMFTPLYSKEELKQILCILESRYSHYEDLLWYSYKHNLWISDAGNLISKDGSNRRFYVENGDLFEIRDGRHIFYDGIGYLA